MASTASNLALRLATAAVAVPVILAFVFIVPPTPFYLFVLPISLVGAREFFLMTHPGDRVGQTAGIVISAGASVAVYLRGSDARTLLTVLLVVPLLGPLVTLVRLGALETAAMRALALGFGPLFILPLTLLALLRKTMGPTGSGLVLLALGLAWLADTAAYFAGRYFGRRKLYEAVSPKKTVEGALGGLAGSLVWGIVASLTFLKGALPLANGIALALVAGVLGQAGDLGESLLKRSTGVKDSGAIVPGHGGVLDRVDALIVTSALVFLYAAYGHMAP
jgi:phosphatidate cytidylyltransferase